MRRKRQVWVSYALVAALGLAAAGDLTYIVVEGDTVWGIARRYGTSGRAIAERNRLPNVDLVRIGQQLTIPGTAAPGAAAAVPTTIRHTVAAGENLSRIAVRYRATVPGLVEVNKLTNPDHLRLGQVLTIPVEVTPAATAPAAPAVEQLLVRYSRHYGVDPDLVKAVAWQESGWKQGVVSATGAIGVMQVQPATGAFAAEILLSHTVDLNDLEHNVKAGVRFLAYLLRQNKGNETYAVASYYQGLRSVREHGMYTETRRYVANVKALKKRFAKAA
ncbi:MAG: LysM peptidoglycan-binding domain-containing protein [Actinomycetota bacterium]